MTFRFDVSGRRWQAVPAPALSRHHKDWLTRGGALTRHLCALGRVSVRVVAERVMPADADQCRAIGVAPRSMSQQSHISITASQYARAVAALASIAG